MLKTLLRVRMAALASGLTGSSRSKKPQTKAKIFGFTLLLVYSFGAIGFMFWHYFSAIAAPFHVLGLDWVFFSIVGISAFSLMFVGSVFFAKAQLYEAKDNELLLSMPVPPGSILLSRTLMILVVSVVFALPVVAPAAIIALRDMEMSAAGIFAFALLFLLLPFFTLALSALFGWLLSIATARVKRKSLFGTAFCIIALVLYTVFVAKINSSIMDIASHVDAIAGSLGAITPVYWFGSAIGEGRMNYALILSGIIIVIAAVAYKLLSVTFIRAATAKRGFAKTLYVERRTAAAAPDKALFRRELARLGSSSAYITNAGMGSIMMVIGAVALLIKRRALVALLVGAELTEIAPWFFVMGLCLLASLNLISASSVSMEGANLWIVRSLPVKSSQVLSAKLRVHLVMCLLPLLLLCACCFAALKLSIMEAFFLFALPIAMTVFVGLLGLAENLRHPNLEWTNEAQAVKTGFGMLFTMLISWVVLALPVLAVVFLGPSHVQIIAFAYLALLVLAALYLQHWVKNRGAARFEEL